MFYYHYYLQKFLILSSKCKQFSSLFYLIFFLNSCMYGGRAPKGELCNIVSVCLSVCLSVCIYVFMYVCMYVCMYVGQKVCIMKGTVLQKTVVGFQRSTKTTKQISSILFPTPWAKQEKGKEERCWDAAKLSFIMGSYCRSGSCDIAHGLSGLCSSLKVLRDVVLIVSLLTFNPTPT